MFIKKIIPLIFFLFLVGCTTPGAVLIKDQNLSLGYLQKVVQISLPAGKRKSSTNAREYYSNYFVFVRGKFRPVQKTSRRFFTKVTILGDRRPYSIEVMVIKEQRVKSSSGGYDYIKAGLDLRLAKYISRMIKKELFERRNDRNFVDDFRVF